VGRTLQTPHFPYIYSDKIDTTLQNITVNFCLLPITDYQLPITDDQFNRRISFLPGDA
jgi:hypothetical protein